MENPDSFFAFFQNVDPLKVIVLIAFAFGGYALYIVSKAIDKMKPPPPAPPSSPTTEDSS